MPQDFYMDIVTDNLLRSVVRSGSILGAHVTEVIGAKMDEERWELVKEKVSKVYKA